MFLSLDGWMDGWKGSEIDRGLMGMEKARAWN